MLEVGIAAEDGFGLRIRLDPAEDRTARDASRDAQSSKLRRAISGRIAARAGVGHAGEAVRLPPEQFADVWRTDRALILGAERDVAHRRIFRTGRPGEYAADRFE